MKIEKRVFIQALYKSILIITLLEDNPEPSEEELKIFLADAFATAENSDQIEALENWPLEQIKTDIEDQRKIDALFQEIFKK